MANCNSKAAVLFLSMKLVLSLILVINMAESRLFVIGFGLPPKSPGPDCVSIYGAVKGDTCFSVAQQFNLTFDFFNETNPNLDCDKIFIGQWLCINGSV